MVKYTKEFCIKQKEKEIQKKIRIEERRMLKEAAYKRKLKKQREKHKAMKEANGAEYQSYLEKRRMYYRNHHKKYEKCRLKTAYGCIWKANA